MTYPGIKISATVITVLLMVAGFIWYYYPTEYSTTSYFNDSYQTFVLRQPEKIDFIPTEALEQIKRQQNTLFEKGNEIPVGYFYLNNIAPESKTGEPYTQIDTFTRDNEVYFVSTTIGSGNTWHEISINNQLYFSEELCSTSDFQQAISFEKIGEETALYFNQGPCETKTTNGASVDVGMLNIYFRGQRFNETYNVSSSRRLFIYQNQIGFIGNRNNQEFVFLNGQPISVAYNRIIDEACCAAPRYWQLYDNGALMFMATSDLVNETYIVEIDLNKYL